MTGSEQGSFRSLVSRRKFLKVTGVAAGATALALGPGQPVLRALAEGYKAGQDSNDGEQIIRSVCRANCFGICNINVHVRDGRITKTSQAPFPDPKFNRICPRGLAATRQVYSSTRIKYPMKRAGERGEGKWERISWDQAINEITEKNAAIQQKYGKDAVARYACSGNGGNLVGGATGRFFAGMQATSIYHCLDRGHVAGYTRVYGKPTIGNGDSNGIDDIVNAKSIFLWSFNLTVTAMHTWHFIAEAIENGAKLTVIDPNFRGIASKAHRHVSPRPGSDTALMMSMMQVIIEEKIYDRPFMLANTCAPLLVRSSDGLYLRMSHLGVPATVSAPDAVGKTTTIDPYVVWDSASGKAVPVGSVSNPALEGTFTANGVSATTAFDLLKKQVSGFTPEKAIAITEVDPSVVREIAREMATAKPAANLMGFGLQAYNNAPNLGHALGTLNALTGNVGHHGNATGCSVAAYTLTNGAFGNPDGLSFGTLPALMVPELLEKGSITLNGRKFQPPKALWTIYSNPFVGFTGLSWWLEKFVPSLDLIVALEIEMTDTAKMADYVLPVSQWYEYEDTSTGGITHPYIQFANKAIEPLFESKPDVDIFRLLAKKMGMGKYFEKSNAELLKEVFESPAGIAAGYTLERLRKEQAIKWMPDNYVVFENQKYKTPSGRMEFYCENPTAHVYSGRISPERRAADRLPSWVPPTEAWPENSLHAKYPLVCMGERARGRAHTSFFSNTWLLELFPEPTVKMNPVDAQARGIANGDYVEIFNDRGKAVVKAVVTEAIRPGILSYPKGWQRYQYKSGNAADLTPTAYDEIAVNMSFFDALADVRKWNGQV